MTGGPGQPLLAHLLREAPTEEAKSSGVLGSRVELRKVVPEPGSYLDETSYFERDWQQSFWGLNYQRLRRIKDKYDPDGLFFVHHGVGREDWSVDGFGKLSTK